MSAKAASNTVKSSGLLWLGKINTSGNNSSPTYATIGSETTGKMSFKNKEIDVTGKDDSGWDAYIPGIAGWTYTNSGIILLSDGGLQQIQNAMKASTPVYIEISGPSNFAYAGNAVLTAFEPDFPLDKAASYTITLVGDQALDVFNIF